MIDYYANKTDERPNCCETKAGTMTTEEMLEQTRERLKWANSEIMELTQRCNDLERLERNLLKLLSSCDIEVRSRY